MTEVTSSVIRRKPELTLCPALRYMDSAFLAGMTEV